MGWDYKNQGKWVGNEKEMTKLELSLFGSLEVKVKQHPIALSRTLKMEALLIYLAIHPIKSQPRTKLTSLLFPEHSPKMARANFRQTLSRLRTHIQDNENENPLIFSETHSVQMVLTANDSIDVIQFQKELAGCTEHRGKRRKNCGDCIELLERAVQLHRGPFLEGFSLSGCDAFNEWVDSVRYDCHQEMLQALSQLAAYYEKRGEYDRAIRHLEKRLAIEKWLEESYIWLMRLYMWSGQRGKALGLYERLTFLLREELGLNPSPEAEALFQKIGDLPPHRPVYLPDKTPSANFLGREKELGDLHAYLVNPSQRLVTITGEGGIGKSQLLLTFGRRFGLAHFGPFSDGVFYVALNEIETAVPLATLLMATLTIEDKEGGASPEDQILNHLQDKACLLIIDNGEYLSEGRLLLSKLVQQTTAVKVLVGSRTELHLKHEVVYRLDGLRYPKQRKKAELRPTPLPPPDDSVQRLGAIQLFLRRAANHESHFRWRTLPDDEKASIVQICQLLDGVPLAIEMAAALTPILSCREILHATAKELTLLANVQLDLPKRHQSVRAVFEHSWRLLSESDQQGLATIAIFAGDFPIQVAQEVAEITFATAQGLVQKSLLKTRTTKNGKKRMQLSQLVRQFALEKLTHSKKTDLEKRYVHHYGIFLQSKNQLLGSEEASQTLTQIQEEIENIRFGWHWIIKNETLSLLALYLEPLYRFYIFRGWRHEGYYQFQSALALRKKYAALADIPVEQTQLFAKLLSRTAGFYYELNRMSDAELLIQESVQLAHVAEESDELTISYKRLGQLAYSHGNYKKALSLFAFSLKIAEEAEDLENCANLHMYLGAIHRDEGALSTALTHFKSSVHLYQKTDVGWGLAHANRLLADALFSLEGLATAVPLYKQSLALCRELRYVDGEGLVHQSWGRNLFEMRQTQEAEHHLLESLTLFENSENKNGLTLTLHILARLKIGQRHCQDGKKYLRQSFSYALELQNTPLILDILLDVVGWSQGCQQDRHIQTVSHLLQVVQRHPHLSRPQRLQVAEFHEQYPYLHHQEEVDFLSLTQIEALVNELWES